MNNTSKKLGENIRERRLAQNMTQGDLCKKLQIDVGYLSNLEQGKKNPTLATIERIAKVLQVSVDELMK